VPGIQIIDWRGLCFSREAPFQSLPLAVSDGGKEKYRNTHLLQQQAACLYRRLMLWYQGCLTL
jgi:hypothetical protein